MLKRIAKTIGWIVGALAVLIVALLIYVSLVSSMDPPHVDNPQSALKTLEHVDSNLTAYGDSWFRKSESGLYEMYVEGDPYERGVAIGQMSQALMQHQEKVFNDQIETLVPSSVYREMLKYFVGWFNRDMDEHVAEEFKLEIYGMSQSSSHDYDNIAPAYQRLMSYHGAHDIGHALQNMSLVGCTAFATWGSRSQDSTLIVGRNFDFYVGDAFAENKVVAFYKPSSGHPFMMLTFPGMIGVLSGMNAEGLTVTINAAKSEIPNASATPVSIVAREILQYASTIDEAFAIANKRKMFVAESFLIASARDGRAAIIEKNTEETVRYDAAGDYILSTNHFQSKKLGETQLNQQHIKTSASLYRYQRLQELLDRDQKNSVAKTVGLLRNQKGLSDRDIGMGNEKAINQMIAHHGIVFQPEKKLVWVSTAPWQMGKFVCYDLNKIFSSIIDNTKEIHEPDKTLAADPFLNTKEFHDFAKMSSYRFPFQSRAGLDADSVVLWNPEYYHAYTLAGDRYYELREYEKAAAAFKEGLTKEIATSAEREHMEKYLQKSEDHLLK